MAEKRELSKQKIREQKEDNMNMLPKLNQDFGVTAFLATLVVIGSFALMIIGLATGKASIGDLLPMIGAWVGSIVTAFFIVKSIKIDKGG